MLPVLAHVVLTAELKLKEIRNVGLSITCVIWKISVTESHHFALMLLKAIEVTVILLEIAGVIEVFAQPNVR